jgi:basic membrane protein A
MLKRVDVAAYSFFTAGVEGFEASAIPLGLAEDGVGYALDEHNAELISEEMIAAAEAAREAIVAGDIQVHDYTSDNSCPL